MKHENTLALIVAYYLSRFDKSGYEALGFSTFTEAFEKIGGILNVNPNSIKNMRDEFDPIHDNPRVGWYQRDLRPSRKKVVTLFQDATEPELHDVVNEILSEMNPAIEQEIEDIITPIEDSDKTDSKRKPIFICRAATGRKAEEYFVEKFLANKLPFKGELTDTRELGCGYDFKITSNKIDQFIEVKGLDGASGGATLTSKEWELAKINGENFHLFFVRNLGVAPEHLIITAPYKKLRPQKAIITTVQIRWNITEQQLEEFK